MTRFANGIYAIVFCIYCFGIIVLSYWILNAWFPEYLINTDSLNKEKFLSLFGFFTGVAFFSFVGASYTVHGQLINSQSQNNKPRRKFRNANTSRRPSTSSRSTNSSKRNHAPRSSANKKTKKRSSQRQPQMRP